MKTAKPADAPCVPNALRAAFGWPKPPARIWQEPFDYFRGHCEQIANPSEPTDLFAFCDYFLDYQYMPVQRDLLHFALPEALEAWARRDLKQPDAAKFKGNWHFEGMWDAFAYRPLHPDFLTDAQYAAMNDFLVSALFQLMRKEHALAFKGSYASAYDWIRHLATFICLFPVTEQVWSKWWSYETPQMAVCGVQWLSAFLYQHDENPYFAPWKGTQGGGPPLIFETNIVQNIPASPKNIAFLEKTLTKEWACDALTRAAGVLVNHAQSDRVQQTAADFEWRSILFEERVEKYIKVLKSKGGTFVFSWDEI